MARNRVVRRSFGSRGRSSGRLTEWFGKVFATDNVVLAASSFVIDSSMDALEKAKRPFTIMRTVGSIWVNSDQVSATEQPMGAFGMMVVSEKAVTTGATAVPDPVTQVASDEWYVYQSFAASGANSAAYNGSQFIQFDSRAQRKVQDGEDIVAMVANASAANGLFYILNFRFLVKLS